MNSIEFSRYLKNLREAQDISIRQLSLYSGVSNSYISQLETGKRGVPKPDILEKLAPALKVSYESLMVKAGYIDLKNNEDLINIAPRLTPQDEKDVEKKLIETMDYIESQEGLMLNGELMDESDKLLLMQAIEMGLKYASENAKRRFTRGDHKKGGKK